jgi:hypothetical protein
MPHHFGGVDHTSSVTPSWIFFPSIPRKNRKKSLSTVRIIKSLSN